jgi:hypothetical protein
MSAGDPHLTERSERAAKIIAQPGDFKVCESCDSIVTARVALCPNCNGYRFNPDAEAVIAQARALAARAQTTVTHDDLQ